MISTADPMRAFSTAPGPVVPQAIAAPTAAIRPKSLGDVVFTLPAVAADGAISVAAIPAKAATTATADAPAART